MRPETLKAIRAILETDQTIGMEERSVILDSCRNPKIQKAAKPSSPHYLTPREAAEILKVHRKTLCRMEKRGQLHKTYLSKRCVRYSLDDIEMMGRNRLDDDPENLLK